MPTLTWNTLHEETFEVPFEQGSFTAEVRHEISGSFNYVVIDKSGSISAIRINSDGSAELHSVWRFTSSSYGQSTERMAIFNDVVATYIGSGAGYITLRYSRESKAAAKTYTYNALVGIISE